MTGGRPVPFEPVAGGRARWKVLYDLLSPLGEGDVLSYGEIADALGCSRADRHVWQYAMRRAVKQFAVQNKHAVRCVPNEGYVVVGAREHLSLSREQQQRARRAIVRGRDHVLNVDFSQLSAEDRQVFESQAQVLSQQVEYVRRVNASQARVERLLVGLSQERTRSQEEDAVLRARLSRLTGFQD